MAGTRTQAPQIISIINNIDNDNNNETGSRSPCMRPRSDPPKTKNSNVVRSRLIILINEEINEANWMARNSAKLDRRTKQHTQFGVSASNSCRDMARTKSWQKKTKKIKKQKTNEANWMVNNSAQLNCRAKQHTQFGVSASNGYRDMAGTKSWRKKKKNNKANWMVSNSAQLDHRTKQHTQFGVSASNGSKRYGPDKIVANSSREKKIKKKK